MFLHYDSPETTLGQRVWRWAGCKISVLQAMPLKYFGRQTGMRRSIVLPDTISFALQKVDRTIQRTEYQIIWIMAM
jgi:hypothetical protein